MYEVTLNIYKFSVQIPLHVSAGHTEGILYVFDWVSQLWLY